MTVDVSVVLPCLNEIKTLGTCIDVIREAFARGSIDGEIVVADNGSSDGSQAVAIEKNTRLVQVDVRGYGSALRAGIAAAQGRYVIFGDADCSYDFLDIPRFIERLDAGDELVVGNRFRGKIHRGAMPWLHQYLGNPVLSFLGRKFFRVPIGDFHCGLRGFRKDAFDRLGLISNGMEFASEMIAKAGLHGLRISEIPIELHPDGRDRRPHLRTWRDGWRHLRFMMLMCPRWLFWYPGVALLLISSIAFAALEITTIYLGGLTLDIHTLLVAGMAMVVGVQLMIFALFTERLSGWIGLHPVVHVEPISWAHRHKLELGVLAGTLAFGVGFSLLAWKTWTWMTSGFSALDPVVSMRVVIPSVVSMAIGLQVVFGSFFLSFLNVARAEIALGKRKSG